MTAADLTQNYFDLFAIPLTYTIDSNALESRYRELQRTVHPDKFVNGSDQEKRISMQQTTYINQAYQTLKNPVARGRYMLELAGHQINEETHTTRDMMFLTEQIELREILEDIRSQSDPLRSLDHLTARIDSNISGLENDLDQMLQQAQQESAMETVLKMQFYSKLRAEVSEVETILEDELYNQ